MTSKNGINQRYSGQVELWPARSTVFAELEFQKKFKQGLQIGALAG
jgi:hypothetical protein